MLLFSLPMLAAIALAHGYLYRRWLGPITGRPWLKRGAIALSVVALGLGLGARSAAGALDGDVPRGFVVAALVWVGFLLYTLFLSLLLDGSNHLSTRWRKRHLVDPERRQMLGAGVALAASTIAGYGAYRAFEAPEVTEVVVPMKGLPKALEGFTIAQLSDVHVGPVIQRQFLRELCERTNAAKPDLTVITGDLVDGSVAHLGRFVRELQGLRARRGVYFITGNHDYYSGVEDWVAAISGLGIEVLRNRHVAIAPGLSLAGVDDWSATRFGEPGYDLDRALAGADLDQATVLLAHQPANFDEVAARGVGLQLSGHTHGGQFFPITLGASAIWRDRARGLSRTGDSHIFVSRGCGFVGPPFRVGAAPEIAKIILVQG